MLCEGSGSHKGQFSGPHFPCAGAMASRRHEIMSLIRCAEGYLAELRNAEQAEASACRERFRTAAGERRIACYVKLRLMERYGISQSVIVRVSKLMLPRKVWSPEFRHPAWSWEAVLLAHMESPKVARRAQTIWDNRTAAQHRGTVIKVKRLVAETYVFAEIMQKNGVGVMPKAKDLTTLLKRKWPYSDPATDAFPDTLTTGKKRSRWLHRFRRFWKVKWSKLPLRGFVTPEIRSHKVFKRFAGNECAFWSHF